MKYGPMKAPDQNWRATPGAHQRRTQAGDLGENLLGMRAFPGAALTGGKALKRAAVNAKKANSEPPARKPQYEWSSYFQKRTGGSKSDRIVECFDDVLLQATWIRRNVRRGSPKLALLALASMQAGLDAIKKELESP